MTKIRLKLLLFCFLALYLASVVNSGALRSKSHNSDSDDWASADHQMSSESHETVTHKAEDSDSAGGVSPKYHEGGEATEKVLKAGTDDDEADANFEVKKKSGSEKAPKSESESEENSDTKSKLKGDSGRIMHAVTQAIKDLNPIRMLVDVDLDPLLNIKGLNLDKIKAPISFFSKTFFNEFCSKTQMDIKQLGSELGTDLKSDSDSEMVSIGAMLKIGEKNRLKLGDYIGFLGIDLQSITTKYDNLMTEIARKPVELADNLLNDGFQKTMQKIKEFVNQSGGPMNVALKLVGDATGKDVVGSTQNAIKSVTNFSVKKTVQDLKKEAEEMRVVSVRATKNWVKENFGKGSPIRRIPGQISDALNSVMKFMNSIAKGDQLQAFVDMIGKTIGPTGRSIAYITYAPTSTMLNQVFGPLLLVPKILDSDHEMLDKILALPPVIIQMSGGMFKPVLMVGEPLLRLARFLATGEYSKSLSAGLDISAEFGISIWGGAFKNKKGEGSETKKNSGDHEVAAHKKKSTEINHSKKSTKAKKRTKRETKKGKSKKGKSDSKKLGAILKNTHKKSSAQQEYESEDEGGSHDLRDLSADQKLADAYQGGPPPGGYKIGVQNDGRTNLNGEDFVSRLLLSPDFILKAGGTVYVPFSSVLAPVLRAVNTMAFGTGDFNRRMAEVPEILRGVGLVGPLADVIQAALPFIKLAHSQYKGELSATDIVMQTPALAKELTSGTLYKVYKNPKELMRAMFSWLEGNGGVLAQMRMQANGMSPVAAPGAATEYKIESSFVADYIGEFFGGWFLTYIQVLGPIGSTIAALYNGVIGNVIDPVKFLDSEPNLRNQPLKNLLNSFDDLPKMYNMSADPHMFLISLLGGQDPDPLKNIGLYVGKMAAADIDPALVLTSGTKLLSPEAKNKLQDDSNLDSVGINDSKLSKVNLNVGQVLDSGLLDANEDKLRDIGIDTFTIINRVMRNSIEDKYKLMMAGINPKIMLKAGIDPAFLLAGGLNAVKESALKNNGIDKESVTNEDLSKIGLNAMKLTSKGIDAKKLALEGVNGFSKTVVKNSLGINPDILTNSITSGLEPEKLKKAGVDVKKMVSQGIDPKLLLTGGLRAAMKGEVSKSSLSNIGLDMDQIVSMGININLLLDVGASVLNPVSLIKMGIDPQRSIIGCLSRSGLDTLTGGMDDQMSATLGFVTSILQIMKQITSALPAIRDIPVVGPMIMGKDGKFTGIPGFILYRVFGIDNHGGLLQFCKKLFSGKLTMAEILELLNPLRITQAIANPNGNTNAKFRSKSNRKPVDDYGKTSSSELKSKKDTKSYAEIEGFDDSMNPEEKR